MAFGFSSSEQAAKSPHKTYAEHQCEGQFSTKRDYRTEANYRFESSLSELSAAKEASLDEIWEGARKAAVPNAQIWALLQNARDTQKIKKALQASVRDDAVAEQIALNEVIFAKLNQPQQPTRWRVLTGLGDGIPAQRRSAA